MIKMEYMRLNDGNMIPIIGHGISMRGPQTSNVPDDVLKKGLKIALENGHRLIDTAHMYDRDIQIGEVLKEVSIKREDIFICTKVIPKNIGDEEAMDAWLEKSMKDMGVDYFDLLLLHFPTDSIERDLKGWKVLEKYKEKGLVKSIGVSNFEVYELRKLLQKCKIIPAVNQVEASFLHLNRQQFQFCMRNDIQIMGYTPLGRGMLQNGKEGNDMMREALKNVCEKFKISQSQALLAFLLFQGIIPIVRSNTESHIKENLETLNHEVEFLRIYISLWPLHGRRRIMGSPDAC